LKSQIELSVQQPENKLDKKINEENKGKTIDTQPQKITPKSRILMQKNDRYGETRGNGVARGNNLANMQAVPSHLFVTRTTLM
jgi:hypothetical protein